MGRALYSGYLNDILGPNDVCLFDHLVKDQIIFAGNSSGMRRRRLLVCRGSARFKDDGSLFLWE